MNFQRITSRENAFVKQLRALQGSARERMKNGIFLLEGLRICNDAMENGVELKTLVVSDGAAGKYADNISLLSDCAERKISVPDELFKYIGDTENPQGIIATAKIPMQNSAPETNGKYLGLEMISDPSNLGAAARTAEALGVSGIVLSGGCDPYAPKSLRASMGTLLRLPLFITDDIIRFARSNGLKTVACVARRDAALITDIEFSGGELLLIGNEANGLSPDTVNSSDLRVTIPMLGSAESLNAAAAAAIGMWEMMRR